jgi:uncharacterized protein
MSRAISRVVDFCARHAWATILIGAAVMLGAAAFDGARFSINADVESLISGNLPWHARQAEMTRDFPQKGISVVVSAPTPEGSALATGQLARALEGNSGLIHSVSRPDSGHFFERNGLLFGSLSDVRATAAGLATARPVLSQLAADPSLRGVMKALAFAGDGVHEGRIRLEQLGWPLSLGNEMLTNILSGRPAFFSWQELLEGHRSSSGDLRHFIEVDPELNFKALRPGREATNEIHRAAMDLHLEHKYGASISLTGQVPMDDDQFSVIRHSALRDTLAALLGVLVILWLALRSPKIMLAVFFSLMVGLAATAALGLAIVGSFNLISIAFFVLFVGLGVDFGIQFSVRYRAERHDMGELRQALRSAARKSGKPLALAAIATAVGFFSFLPTNYRGLSELGLIAGFGMLIAFGCSLTLVPAMIVLLNPGGETEPVGFGGLGALDDFLQRHRIPIIVGTVLVVLAGSPLLFHLRFDFNPVDLQNPSSPSVMTYRELQDNAQTNTNDAEILAPSLDQANAIADRLSGLPEISRAVTLSHFLPKDQAPKIAALRHASTELGGALGVQAQPAPDDEQNIAAINAAADALTKAAGNAQSGAADSARRLAASLRRLAKADVSLRNKAEAGLVPPLKYDLDRLRESLAPETVTIRTLPPDLVRDWLLPDGRARVQVMPKGDSNDSSVLRRFATAVLRVEPNATGTAVSFYESAQAVIRAFLEAGFLALLTISILLTIALRRIADVLLTLIPLLVAGAVTLEISAVWGPAFNFANVLALPLLLGVGVAFKIYYIMAWRAGKTGLLQSSLTRAVVFSALTNAVAFGSMWASNYPGMSSMGKMMALALLCTLAAAVLFQPVLMGKPRQMRPHPSDRHNALMETSQPKRRE